MVRACHYDNLIPRYRGTFDLLTMNGRFDKPQFGHSALDSDCDLGGIPNTHSDLNLRMGTTKYSQVSRQPIIRNGVACLNRKHAALQTAKLHERKLSGVDGSKY